VWIVASVVVFIIYQKLDELGSVDGVIAMVRRPAENWVSLMHFGSIFSLLFQMQHKRK
jgi:hypothetical protein